MTVHKNKVLLHVYKWTITLIPNTQAMLETHRIFMVQTKLLSIMPDTRDNSKVYKRYM